MVIHCMDFRLGSAIRNELDKRGILDDCDIVALAGAGRPIIKKDDQIAWHDTALSHIDLSKRLHGIKKLVIMHHTDCGAYGGHAAFESLEAEIAQYKSDMEKEVEVVKGLHPDLEVEKVLVHIEDDGSIRFEDVE